jgi:hypothetical protein
VVNRIPPKQRIVIHAHRPLTQENQVKKAPIEWPSDRKQSQLKSQSKNLRQVVTQVCNEKQNGVIFSHH